MNESQIRWAPVGDRVRVSISTKGMVNAAIDLDKDAVQSVISGLADALNYIERPVIIPGAFLNGFKR